MNIPHEVVPMASIMQSPQVLVGSMVGLSTLIGGWKGYEKVDQTEMGIRTHLGRPVELRDKSVARVIAEEFIRMGRGQETGPEVRPILDEAGEKQYKTVGPGRYVFAPFIKGIDKVGIAVDTNPLPEFGVDCEDGPQMLIRAEATWFVNPDSNSLYKALYKANNGKDTDNKHELIELKNTVLSFCAQGLGQVLKNKDSKYLRTIAEEEVSELTKAVCADKLSQFGAELMSIQLLPMIRKEVEVLAKSIENASNPAEAAIAAAVGPDENGRGAVIPIRRSSRLPGGDAA